MANFYSSLYAAPADGGTGYSYIGPVGGNAGETITVYGTFTATGALATSDIGNLFVLPAGAKLTRYAHYYTDFGTTCTTTVQVGTTDLKASIALGTAVTLANIADLTAAEYTLGWAAVASANATVNLDFTSVSTPTAGAVYTFIAQYAMT